MRLQGAAVAPARPDEVALETDLVKLGLRAAVHHPILMAVYAGPEEWLEEAKRDPSTPATLAREARDLESRAEAAADDYVAGQAHSIAVQLESSLGVRLPYDRMVGELLGAPLEPPTAEERDALRQEVLDLASRLEPGSAATAVERWEARRMLTGEAKWDAAIEAYVAGRRQALGGGLPAFDENLEIIRITERLWSVNLTWYPPHHMTFQVNVATPRAAETVAFEVAHNIYPGDYLHLAVLQQHTYGRRGHVAAAIKLKNAPESVISEGIEETAYLRFDPDPAPGKVLATKLEWLRRIATLDGALELAVGGRPEDEVLRAMERQGFMDPARARFQLDLIKHPLWGPYQYTYLLGRRLVEEADRRAGRRPGGAGGAAYLEYLYGALHTPRGFIAGLDAVLGS